MNHIFLLDRFKTNLWFYLIFIHAVAVVIHLILCVKLSFKIGLLTFKKLKN